MCGTPIMRNAWKCRNVGCSTTPFSSVHVDFLYFNADFLFIFECGAEREKTADVDATFAGINNTREFPRIHSNILDCFLTVGKLLNMHFKIHTKENSFHYYFHSEEFGFFWKPFAFSRCFSTWIKSKCAMCVDKLRQKSVNYSRKQCATHVPIHLIGTCTKLSKETI